jgi:hypothetical protein
MKAGHPRCTQTPFASDQLESARHSTYDDGLE